MSDKTLTCRDCGQEFTFTAGEQAFYQERGFSEPQRCPACRSRAQGRSASSAAATTAAATAAAAGATPPAGTAAAAGIGGGGGGYSSGPRQMYPAVCSNCGKETEVPFQPRSDKPVYCRECFAERRASQPPRYSNY